MKKKLNLLCLLLFLLCLTGCAPNRNEPKKDLTNISKTPLTDTDISYSAEQPINQSKTTKSIRFVVLADSRGSDRGVNSEVVKNVLNEIKQLSPQPEFAIMPGDLTGGSKTYVGVKSQLLYFKDIVTKFYPESFYYPGVGNHEMIAGKGGEKAFSEVFRQFNAKFLEGYHRTVYYFDIGNARIFMLNSDHPGEMHKITGKQLDWLKANLDETKKFHIFLLHEPPYPTGAEAGNSLDKFPKSRDAFWKVVNNSRGPIVFCGHEHNYSRRLIDSTFNNKFNQKVYQVITGGFGAPLYTQYTSKKNMVVPPVPEYHFSVVDLTEQGMSIQAINVDNKVIDSFQVKY